MSKSKELLSKIAALRVRLDGLQAAGANSPPPPPTGAPHFSQPPTRLTHRAAQLLKDARGILAELKPLADDPRCDDQSILANLQREAAALLDVILRNLLTMPAGAAEQLRHCEGLTACLNAARDKVALLAATMNERRRREQTIDDLAALLRRLFDGQSIDLGDFLPLARTIADDAIQGVPLFPAPTPREDVARLAAHQGLATARVQAWILRGEIAQRQRLAELLIPALIHDVGMLGVSEQAAFKTDSLDGREREDVLRHPSVGRDAAARLYPGGGWPLDAIADHHERLDGSGYPAAKTAIEIGEPARLLAVCDVYAALAADRAHRPANDARTALADTLMLAEQGTLDRAQAEKLLRLTFYPAGSVVQLSDGSIGLVVGAPRAMVNPAKAIVIPLRRGDGAAPFYPWPIDLAESNALNILRALTPAERAEALGRSHPALV